MGRRSPYWVSSTALLVPDHPRALPSTGVVHACGHNAQLTHMLGIARALVETGAAQSLAGRVLFMAVPAEEYVDLEWRSEQAAAGRIEFLGGKAELLRLGELDGVDMAILVHGTGSGDDRELSLRMSANGLVAKRARFIGRASHAGAAPERGHQRAECGDAGVTGDSPAARDVPRRGPRARSPDPDARRDHY